MSAESQSLLVIGGFFTVVAVILSVLIIKLRRASLRFDEWLNRKIDRAIILFRERRKGASRG